LSGRGLCDELTTRPEESYRLCCVVVCDPQTEKIGAPCIYLYIYDISSLRVKKESSFLIGAQDSHLQTVTTPKTAYIQLRRRPPKDEQGNARNL
jgi:hypothetical protein